MGITEITSLVALMMAVSIAVERMVEVLKGWFANTWLFKPNADPIEEARRCMWIHILAAFCGAIVAYGGNIDVFATIHAPGWKVAESGPMYWAFKAGSFLVTGVLASGGSAFWNHALDLLKATKVQQEQKAGI